MALNIYYWPARGLGEPIISLLEYCELPYTVHRLHSLQEWASMKQQLPAKGCEFPNLPLLEHQGVYVSESFAIMAYIAKLANKESMIPVMNDEQLVLVLEYNGVVKDFQDALFRIGYSSKSLEEFKQEYFKTVESNKYKIQRIEKIIAKRKWLIGNDITLVDFRLVELIEKLKEIEADLDLELIGQFHNLENYLCRFYGLPQIKEYRASDRFMARPFNVSTSIWK